MIKKLLLTASLATCISGFSQTSIFKEDFETEAGRNSWINTDRDGDGEKWEFDNSEIDSFTGFYATSWSWFFDAFTPDNTLTSPSIILPNNADKKLTLKFDIGAFDEEVFQEHYAVYVIPANTEFAGTEIPIFEETLDAGYMDEAKHVNIDISEYAGQDVRLVFRHYDCTDLLVLLLDNIEVLEEPKLAISDINKTSVKIYPNPTSDILKVSGLNKIEKIRIFDMNGHKVLETQNSETNLKNLLPGSYIVNIYSENNVISRKIIKK
ncbi:T9SS-dependent choice-of-anchor J family protein [Chryseobacterium sp. POL2]|uniref:T9SS-dependent choice-of-anchor J family protein n=1 Tax=Chryseobacterium sp. POL2 TaxID=2713414 RepID=UPI0013E0FDF5|nr:T9SS type A sorting domain-containing protein [Chryseobacterium sp. POL2]QIG88998.1 T9SS type A sorting domain-containing protein [Chryseobacterium sp. POL2]